MNTLERLRDKANSLPESAGVYIMKDADGNVIYVGKSKKLKNRVTTYFTGNNHTVKTARMVSLVRDFDYIVCSTEIEALTLENVLIKKHSPKYNIKLKDAKSYPYIKVTADEYPKIIVTRERHSDKGHYFGPYQGMSSAYAAVETVSRVFGLATCKRSFPRDIGKGRPCLYKDMGRCIAPCTGKVTREEYARLIKCAEWVLDGNTKSTRDMLEAEMLAASDNMEFERAASLRDSIRALERLSDKQKVVADEKVNRDVFALYTSQTVGVLALLTISSGALINKNEFILSQSELTTAEDALSLIVDYYDTAGNIPREIMLGFGLDEGDAELLSEYLSLNTPYRVRVKMPERGEGRALCQMALENAKESARQYTLEGEREDKNVKRLTQLLGLSEVPKRIEAYDISNIGDESITASMVVWSEGKLKKSDYRIFNIKGTDGRDDYASMREALTRRLSHIGDSTASLSDLPDVLLVDGGVGHVNVAKEVLNEYSLDIPLFGMVKDDYHKTRALTDGENEISIAHELNVYTFIYNIQEEAHRFAVKNTMGQKRKSLTRSSLESVPGIGPSKARKLLHAMPLGKIRKSSVEELSLISGVSRKDAEEIYKYYHKKDK